MRVERLPEVCARTGQAPATIWRKVKSGEFPRPIKVGPNAVGWIADEVDDWLRARIAERDAASAGK